MDRLGFPMELKEITDDGRFSGYAAIFGNLDRDGDILERGAFKEFERNKEGRIVTLWQHNRREPIGTASIEQDDKGLRFDGQLVLDDPLARRARAHMKAGSVRGMSFGFDVLAGGAEVMASGVRMLKALKLWEISPVTFGANPAAGIDVVKSIPNFKSIREAEDWVRDEFFFTASEAKAFTSRFKAALASARDESEELISTAREEQFLKSVAWPAK